MFDVGVDLIREALVNALIIAAPILIAGMVIGLCISLFQTVTQIQEQTLTFVPKIAGMMLVAILMIPWILNRLLTLTIDLFNIGAV
ncbi:MAG: flagellar biosynthetic protein FliQ [Phycisphaerales bacterium]